MQTNTVVDSLTPQTCKQLLTSLVVELEAVGGPETDLMKKIVNRAAYEQQQTVQNFSRDTFKQQFFYEQLFQLPMQEYVANAVYEYYDKENDLVQLSRFYSLLLTKEERRYRSLPDLIQEFSGCTNIVRELTTFMTTHIQRRTKEIPVTLQSTVDVYSSSDESDLDAFQKSMKKRKRTSRAKTVTPEPNQQNDNSSKKRKNPTIVDEHVDWTAAADGRLDKEEMEQLLQIIYDNCAVLPAHLKELVPFSKEDVETIALDTAIGRCSATLERCEQGMVTVCAQNRFVAGCVLERVQNLWISVKKGGKLRNFTVIDNTVYVTNENGEPNYDRPFRRLLEFVNYIFVDINGCKRVEHSTLYDCLNYYKLCKQMKRFLYVTTPLRFLTRQHTNIVQYFEDNVAAVREWQVIPTRQTYSLVAPPPLPRPSVTPPSSPRQSPVVHLPPRPIPIIPPRQSITPTSSPSVAPPRPSVTPPPSPRPSPVIHLPPRPIPIIPPSSPRSPAQSNQTSTNTPLRQRPFIPPLLEKQRNLLFGSKQPVPNRARKPQAPSNQGTSTS
jgi:hypothetical protein